MKSYCIDCGSKLIPKKELHGYYSYTGKPIYLKFYRCPKGTWRSIKHHSSEYWEAAGEGEV